MTATPDADGWAKLAETGPALKEWAGMCRALETGRQAVLLRKGGIHERGFDVDTPSFLLFPTYLHQEADKFRPGFGDLFEATHPEGPGEERVVVRGAAQVVATASTTDRAHLEALAELTVMTPEALSLRYTWRPEQALHILVVRVRRLFEPLSLEVKKSWGGCRSWIQVGPHADLDFDAPVLGDDALDEVTRQVRALVGDEAEPPSSEETKPSQDAAAPQAAEEGASA